MATATKTNFGVCCPFCHDEDAILGLDLNAVGVIRCSGCDEEFSPRQAVEKARVAMAAWEKVARFVEMGMGRELAAE